MNKLPKKEVKESNLEEHQFIANCLQVGLTINDLKQMQYKDVMKILICFMKSDEKNDGPRKATQADIDRLLR